MAARDMAVPQRDFQRTQEISGDAPDFERALREFGGSLWSMAERGEGDQIAALVERLVEAVEKRGQATATERYEQRTRSRGIHNYLNTAIAVLTLATVVFWGGSLVERVNQNDALLRQHDTAIRQMQTQIDTAVQVSTQVGVMQMQLQRLNDRIDRFLDKGR